MPTDHILALLVAERDKLNRAIEALGGSAAKSSGRPAKTAAPDGSSTPRKKRTFTAAQRKEQAARMKAYWAKRRKEAGSGKK